MNETAEFYFARAEERFKAGDAEGGCSDLDQAILLAPDNIEYRKRRADLRYEAEQYKLAVEDFTVLLEFETDVDELTSIRRRRAYFYERLGLIDELIEDLSWVIDHNKGTPNVYAWRATHYQRLGDYQNAVADLSKAHELEPESGNTLIQLGHNRYHAGQYEAAINDLTKALRLFEKHPSMLSVVYHWRGKSHAKLGNTQQALADLNESLRLRGEKPIGDISEYPDIFSFNQ